MRVLRKIGVWLVVEFYDRFVSSCWCGNDFAVRHSPFEWAEIDDTTETNSARLSYVCKVR